mmetsp:Transcript_18101/g.39095  ORF Transcript_18101/g.39095 Transcript_18101/m.39095 type:complete len:207 (+) Transcript_18101:1715-2335(+)
MRLTASVKHSTSLPMPQLMNSSDNLSNLVRDNLLRIRRALRMTSSLLSSPSVTAAASPSLPSNTLAFQRVSSFTSMGLQSSRRGAVSLGFFLGPFRFPLGGMTTSPTVRSALDDSSISETRVGVSHRHAGGGFVLLSSTDHEAGASMKSKRIAKRSSTEIRFTAFSVSVFPSPGFNNSTGNTFPLDQDPSLLSPCSPSLLPPREEF